MPGPTARRWSARYPTTAGLTWPLAGRLPPGADAGAGAGPGDDLWLANQLCDLVQLYSSPGRATIRLHQYV